MRRIDRRFLFLNVGHAIDHLLMLLFPSVAVLMAPRLKASYGELLALSTGGFITFGVFALAAGWLADRWSREHMITIFFVGVGTATAMTGLAREPWQIALALFGMGVFASIYHPVGIAMVSQGDSKVGQRLGINGVWGNMGVALATPVAWWLASRFGWPAAFIVPGTASMAIGVLWMLHLRGVPGKTTIIAETIPQTENTVSSPHWKQVVFVITIATAFGGFIFNSTTIALPKVFDERVMAATDGAAQAGSLVAIVFAVAAFTQIAVGYMIDKFSLKWVFFILSLGDIIVFLLASETAGSTLFTVALGMMMLVFGQIPITDTLIARNTPNHWRGRMYAIKSVVSFVVAATAVPVVAYLHDHANGFTDLFLVCASCSTIITLTVLTLPSTKQSLANKP